MMTQLENWIYNWETIEANREISKFKQFYLFLNAFNALSPSKVLKMPSFSLKYLKTNHNKQYNFVSFLSDNYKLLIAVAGNFWEKMLITINFCFSNNVCIQIWLLRFFVNILL